MKILHSQVLPTLLALAFLLLAPGFAQAQDATSSEDTRGDTWITCTKGKGNNETIVNISDCNSLQGRLQAGFKCTGEGMFECGEAELSCRERHGTCVSPQGEICQGHSDDGGCQPPCKCSVGGGGGGGGRCSHALGALEDCLGLEADTLSCDKVPATHMCIAESEAARECCAGGGGGGSKCESDGSLCLHRLCGVNEINVCIDGQSVCCNPNGPSSGGGGGNSCDPQRHTYCDSNIACVDGERLRRCDPGEFNHCKGGIAYQCVETGGGGGRTCDSNVMQCGVKCEVGTLCVDCDGDGIGETCQ